MSVLPIGFGSSGGVDTGDIGHSLRFRRVNSAYLSRTFGTPTSNTSWAMSLFAKETPVGALRALLSSGYSTVGFNATEQLTLWDSGGGQVANSTALFREPTGHNHWFVRSNGTNIKGYRNGVEVLSYTGTIPGLNSATVHNFGRFSALSTHHPDGVFSRIAFVDNGGSLTPSDFAYLNTEINEWVTKSQSAVKAVVDAGGTNSFMLDFDNATSLTTLGYDKSSKGNNWTLNNFSLTAGSTYDHMLDVPGNSYATLNPLAAAASANLSSANLTNVTNATGYGRVHGSFAMSSGKWYWEATVSQMSTTTAAAGIATQFADTYVGGTSGDVQVVGATAVNQVLAIALDLDANTVAGYIDNVLAYGPSSIPAGSYFPAFSDSHNTVNYCTFNANFGQAPLHASATYHSAAGGYFRYAPPTGFKALCQRNLPDPAILNPELHFDVLLHTGNAVQDRAITGAAFDPDFAWIKNRGAVAAHVLFDRVRGGDKQLFSNLTNAEQTNNDITNGFTTGGIIVGDNITGTGSTNQNTNTYVDWLWKMGGAAVTNNSGSISSQVSANVLAGQSVVTYVGNGGTATIGHGLTRAPELIYVKSRDDAIDGWYGYHASLGATKGIFLNLTSATITSSAYWNDTAPTTSVFTVKGAGVTNRNSDDYVALCFHSVPGYSKIGSYIGNGSADGPYVECGFKPKYVLVKRAVGGTDNWATLDTVRSPYNMAEANVYANASDAETSAFVDIDFLSNGFKLRNTFENASGGTYIFYAVADVAGKYSLGR
jgi:hypothetical protein